MFSRLPNPWHLPHYLRSFNFSFILSFCPQYNNVFTVTGSGIDRMKDRQNPEFKTGYQRNTVYPVGVVYTAVGYHPGLSWYHPTSAEGGKPEAAGKFCSTLQERGTQSYFLVQACSRQRFVFCTNTFSDNTRRNKITVIPRLTIDPASEFFS
jgi:hypothetical protein